MSETKKPKHKILFLSIFFFALLIHPGSSFAAVFFVDINQDTDVISGTQFPGENMSNQGANPEIEPIRANDGFNTKHVVYLGFNLLSNVALQGALLGGDTIVQYVLHAFNVRNFAQGDAVVGDVITNVHYVPNDNWAEGPYLNYTVINSSNPLDGMTFDNQVGFTDFLASENQDGANIWYDWPFLANAFTPGGINDNPNYLSLAMVPNELNKTSAWYLVSSFASKENTDNPHPYLEVRTTAVPEPSSIFLLGFGLLSLSVMRKFFSAHSFRFNHG